MAPEAALGGVPLDARVDLYGLGCVAYWLLTGERVFVGRTPVEVLLHHVKTPPVPPSERSGREIPDALEAARALLPRQGPRRPARSPPSGSRRGSPSAPTAGAWTPDTRPRRGGRTTGRPPKRSAPATPRHDASRRAEPSRLAAPALP